MKIIFLLAFLIISVISLEGNFLPQKLKIYLSKNVLQEDKNQICSYQLEKRIVRGSSLEPLIRNGQEVKVFFNYYKCNEIRRNDIVLYSYAGNNAPLIKIVKGIPGDSFKLVKAGENQWYILINGEVLKNSQRIPYLISGEKYQLLSIYEKNYQGIIPENAYLLLGNSPSGSTDSTSFGLVSQQDILAKVEY